MRQFDYAKLKDQLWDTEVVNYLSQIHEAKGKQTLYLRQKPEQLDRLVEIAKIQSTEASNELLQFVRTAQKAPYVGDMKFKRSGAASAASLRSLSGCARGCRSEYNDQSFHWLH